MIIVYIYMCMYIVCVVCMCVYIFIDIQIKLINRQIATSNADNINCEKQREAKRDKENKKNYENRRTTAINNTSMKRRITITILTKITNIF
jgi:hypothetical protein